MKALLAGLGIGAVLAVLLAPRRGKQTRQLIAKRASVMAENFNSKGSDSAGHIKPNPSSKRSGTELSSESKAVAEVLNSADRHELMSVDGIGKVTATRIMKHRPYNSEEEVLREGVLPEETLENVKKELLPKNRDIA